jgi:hypothetical protein
MSESVEIKFDCLPLRTIGRLDIPLDASPVFRRRCENILAAINKHGSHNAYYLYNASCAFQLTNDPAVGKLVFVFEGTVLTDAEDTTCKSADLNADLKSETCNWLTEPIVDWMKETVSRAVQVEFNRYIAAGDLQKNRLRLEELQKKAEAEGGFMGMYL